MGKNTIILPHNYSAIIQERLGDKYTRVFIRMVKQGARENMEIKREILKLSKEYLAEKAQLEEQEAALNNS